MKAVFDNLRLRTKLLLMMFTLLLLTLAVTFVMYWNAERGLITQVERHTNDLSTAIQISVEQLTSKGRTKEERLRDYVRRLEHRGVREISILSDEREVIASSNPRRVGARIDPKRKDLLITARLGEVRLSDDPDTPSQRTYNLIVPITVGTQKGYILVSMVLDDFTKLVRTNFLKRLVASVLVFTLGIGASIFLSWKYTQPIHQVVEAAKRVAAGDLSETLPGGRQDEIGELTQSFNDMVKRLRLHRELETRLHQAERLSTIGQLASGIAHEVRNPLNLINLSIDHLRSRFAPAGAPDRAQFDRLIDSIKGEVHRLDAMIETFLTYGKPLKLDRKPCDVGTLLAEVTEVAAQKAAQQRITVERRVSPDLPKIQADGEQLKICFMNLLLNAFQAMPSGGRLTITAALGNGAGAPAAPGGATAEAAPAPRPTVEIRFADTGGGIPPEHLPRVFEPYFTTKEVGIGLGLALTKKIVDEHGGTIALESAPGQGTVARVALPVDG